MEMTYISDFIFLYSMNFLNLLIPGANFTITARNSIASSRTAGIFTALGIVCGSSIHKVPTVLGLGFLQAHSLWFYQTLKYAGCVFLFYIGTKTIWNSASLEIRKKVVQFLQQLVLGQGLKIFRRKDSDFLEVSERTRLSPKEAFCIGFLTDILNPQATLCFIAIVGATVNIDTPIKIRAIYSLALVTTSIIWYSLIALFFSQPFLMQRSHEIRPWVERIAGACLITFSYRLFWQSSF